MIKMVARRLWRRVIRQLHLVGGVYCAEDRTERPLEKAGGVYKAPCLGWDGVFCCGCLKTFRLPHPRFEMVGTGQWAAAW